MREYKEALRGGQEVPQQRDTEEPLTKKPKLANGDKTFEDICNYLEIAQAIIRLDVNSEEFIWENAV